MNFLWFLDSGHLHWISTGEKLCVCSACILAQRTYVYQRMTSHPMRGVRIACASTSASCSPAGIVENPVREEFPAKHSETRVHYRTPGTAIAGVRLNMSSSACTSCKNTALAGSFAQNSVITIHCVPFASSLEPFGAKRSKVCTNCISLGHAVQEPDKVQVR